MVFAIQLYFGGKNYIGVLCLYHSTPISFHSPIDCGINMQSKCPQDKHTCNINRTSAPDLLQSGASLIS